MNWLKHLCPSGMRSPAVLRRRGSGLLPAGRPHLVQGLQRSPHPGPLGQNLHRLLTDPSRLCHFFFFFFKAPPSRSCKSMNSYTLHDSTDKKHYSFVQSYFFLFFPPLAWSEFSLALLWVPLVVSGSNFIFMLLWRSDRLLPFRSPTTFSSFIWYTRLAQWSTVAWPAGSLGSTHHSFTPVLLNC